MNQTFRMSAGVLACLVLAACGADDGSNEGAAGVPDENTLALCGDGADNDEDGFIDCADQDCGIFAVCVGGGDAGQPDTSDDASAPDAGDATAADAGTDSTSEPDSTTDDVDAGGSDAEGSADATPEPDVDGPPTCDDFAWCIEASMVMDTLYGEVNGVPSTDALRPLQGATLTMTIGIDPNEGENVPFGPPGSTARQYTGVVGFAATTDEFPEFWRDVVVPGFVDGAADISVFYDPSTPEGSVLISLISVVGPDAFTFELRTRGYAAELNDEGYPLLQAFEGTTTESAMRRIANFRTPEEEMTDYATAYATWSMVPGGTP